MKDISPKLSAFSGSVPGLWFNIMDCPWAVSPFVLIQMGFNYPPVFIPFDSYYFVPCTSRFTTCFIRKKKEVLQRSNMQSYADPYHLYPVPWNIWEDHLLAVCFHSEPSWIQMAHPPEGSEILCQHCRFSPKYVCSRTEQRRTFFHVYRLEPKRLNALTSCVIRHSHIQLLLYKLQWLGFWLKNIF